MTAFAALVARTACCGIVALAALAAAPADAQLVLSQAVLDLHAGSPPRADIEAWNNGPERMYVVAEPSEIVNPGLAGEKRVSDPDPAVTGVLVTPQRMVLEPGQRKFIRVAAVAPRPNHDRIYRVMIKPVVGPVTANATALKVMIGYDVLVILRPPSLSGGVVAVRQGGSLTIRNDGNTNVELYDGRQCDTAGANCSDMPPKRLYPGAVWQQPLVRTTPIRYRVQTIDTSVLRDF